MDIFMVVNRKDLKTGFLFVFLSKVAIIALGIIQITIVPRLLNPINMGLYSYWLSVLLIFSTILDFGGPDILSRYLPELRIKDQDSIRSLFKKNLQVKIILLPPLILAGLYLFREEKAYFIIIFFASVFASVSNLIQAGFYGFKDFKNYSLIQAARILIRLVFVIIFFILLGSIGIIYGLLGGAALCTFLFFPGIKKLVPTSYSKPSKPFTEYLSYGLYLYTGSTLAILNMWLAVILVKNFIPDLEVVGFLGIATQICLFAITGVLSSLSESFFPSLIEFHTNDRSQLMKYLELNWKYTNIILMPTVIGFYFLAEPIVRFFIGINYLPAVEIIKFLLPSVIFITWRGNYQQILALFENKKDYLYVHLAGFISFFIAAVILINKMGVLGAPIAISLGTFISFLFSYFYANRLLHIGSYMMYTFKPFLASILAIKVITIINIDNIYVLLLLMILGIYIYLSSLVLIRGVTINELKSFKHN